MIDLEIQKAIVALKKGQIILYPTDTIWGIGCDATNYEAVQRLYQLKRRHESKSMICLVSDFKMLNQFVEYVPEVAYDILKYSTNPTTIIYDRPKHVAENLIAEDNTLAIRVAHDGFCRKLIKKFKKPIVSTSANLSDQPTPGSFKEIHKDILKGVDYVVNLDHNKKSSKASSIIKLTSDGIVSIIRE